MADNSKTLLKIRIEIAIRIAIVCIVCAVIVWLMPRKGNFQYDYQKGMPWRYETLNAPFDFPIYKTSETLNQEKTEILKNHLLFFKLDTKISQEQTTKFKNSLLAIQDISKSQKDSLLNILRDIYQKGVIRLPMDVNTKDITKIKLVINNVSNDILVTDIFTQKKAYEYFISKASHSPIFLKRETISTLDIIDFIKVNLLYDKQKTENVLEDNISSLSLTEGMISKGEVVISKRELITSDKIKVLNSLKREFKNRVGTGNERIETIMGYILFIMVGLIVFSLYIYDSHKKLLYYRRDVKTFIFLMLMFLLMILLCAVGYYLNANLYIFPVLLFVILVRILINSRAAMYLLLVASLIMSTFAANSYLFATMQILTGSVAIFSLTQLQRRSQLIYSVFFIFISYCAIYISFILIQNGSLGMSNLNTILSLLLNCVLLTLSYPIVYIVEKLFGYTSDITLMELSNPNHPLLRSLTKKAPGTFQHCMMVSNMAEEAIYSIGGNPLLARTGALYHDIGKMSDPLYFIENQSGGVNPHDELEFDESARIIIGHVEKGVELAQKYKLPSVIVDFIRTHHGKSNVKYFYNSFKNKYPERQIDESVFTYKGPDPVSKECAVVMMADAIEASSRALPNKSVENISNLINNIIDSQMADGRFENSEITFKDIAEVKRVYIDLLTNVYHSRIAYPKLKNK